MADYNDYISNAEDVVSGVEVVKKSKKGLVIGGLAVVTAGAFVAVAGGGIAAYCLSDFVKNQVKLRISSPESYYAWVNENNADAAAKQISGIYSRGLEKIEDGQQVKTSLRYDVTDAAKEQIKSRLGLDSKYDKDMITTLDKFQNITIGADGNFRDSLISGKAYIDWNDNRLVSTDLASDTSTLDYFVRIPELSEQWIGVESEKLIDENSYYDYEKNILETFKKAVQDPRSVLSPEEIEELSNRYIKAWNESIDDVKLEKKQTVTINDIDMNYTVVSVELTEKKINVIEQNILNTAKEDDLLKEIVVERLHMVDETEYESEINDALEELKEPKDGSDESVTTVDTYIDAKGVIRGFGLKTDKENQEFLAVIGKQGNKVRGKCYLYDGLTIPEFTIDLNAEESNNKYTGTLDYYVDEFESWSLEFNDFEIVNEEYGFFNAGTVLNITDSDDEYSIPLDFTTDGESQSIAGDIVIDGNNYGTLTFTIGLQTGAEPSIPSKNGSYMIDSEDKLNNFWRNYVSQDEMEKFLTDFLEKLGLEKNMASSYAESYAEEAYIDWDSIYNDDINGWDSDDNDYDKDDIDYDSDDEFDWDDEDFDYDIADGPAVKDGQAFIMVYDKDMKNYSFGDGTDYLSYGAKYADINGDGTYTVSLSADTPEFREHSTAMPYGISLLLLGCEGTHGAADAKIDVISFEIDGKSYTISKDMTFETEDDYFAALIYSDSFFGIEEDDEYKNGLDLSGIQTWKTITITFKLTGMK